MTTWNQLKYRFELLNIAERLIVINVLCFVFPFLLNTIFFLFQLSFEGFMAWFQLSPDWGLLLFRPWSLITYSFLHSGFFHLFWNMLFLYYAGLFFLNLLPAKTFLNTYFLGVLTGGLVFILSYLIFPAFAGLRPAMVGASAGVMAVFVFSATYTPNQAIRLLFFTLKLKHLAIAYVLLDVIQIPYGNAGGHLAHIGGAVLGYTYARELQKGRDLGSGFEKVWTAFFGLFKTSKPLKTVYRSTTTRPKKPRRSTADQDRIDAILDKISASGYDSLSKEEKELLFRAGRDNEA
ncbi:MAG: rhomboid family intramembrane serine protease [Flavobacteriaceae bacterium]